MYANVTAVHGLKDSLTVAAFKKKKKIHPTVFSLSVAGLISMWDNESAWGLVLRQQSFLLPTTDRQRSPEIGGWGCGGEKGGNPCLSHLEILVK